jgi:hypothetical protein
MRIFKKHRRSLIIISSVIFMTSLIVIMGCSNASDSDSIPPDPVSDLIVLSASEGAVHLSWTATGDDLSSGRAAEYDIRYSQGPITEDSWKYLNSFAGAPAPANAGAIEHFIGAGLIADSLYYFGIRVKDDAGNWSEKSNIVSDNLTGKFLFISELNDSAHQSLDLKILDNRVIMADNGISIVDISNPLRPMVTAHLSQARGDGIFMHGDYAYLGMGSNGFRIYDISDIDNPQAEGISQAGGINVLVKDDYAYAGDKIFHLNNGYNPDPVGDIGVYFYDGAIAGDYAFLAGSNGRY